MSLNRWIACASGLVVAGTAFAGPSTVPLGTPVGQTLGIQVGTVLGDLIAVGGALPIGGGGLLLVGAASLGIGVWIARRKKR